MNPLHEIHSTLKAARQNPALRQALGDDFQIVSIEKSLEKNGGGGGANTNFGGFNFQRRGDNEQQQPSNNRNEQFGEFSVGGEIAFSEISPPNIWNGDMNSFPRNHRYS